MFCSENSFSTSFGVEPKKSEDKAVGMSRGGRNTKIHALVDGLGNPLSFLLSSGQDHDSVHAIALLQSHDITGSNILGDKAYGARAIREYITAQNATYTIPAKSCAAAPWPLDRHVYKERHLIECFFQKLKWFRRISTRYDKLDSSFLAFVYIGAISILLK
ncbi:IS5 family transposase [uncultured Desulfovibrio sp.]|uniref:IS5 family transposase n=1 Tax=uncultured Desulfovibrio sp. TaxID=167968 RepID=UPI0026183BB5|nr:IS5 family transposase [uncultured Desulfovibrio sp.]